MTRRSVSHADHQVTKGRRRRAAVVVAVFAIALMVFSGEAHAAVSGDLVYSTRIGTGITPAAAYALAAGPEGVTAIVGERYVPNWGFSVPIVAKYNADGGRLWLQSCTDLGVGAAVAVAIDAYGSVYAAGSVNDLDNTGGYDLALMKYGPAGTLKWVRLYDGPASQSEHVEALLIDKAGNIIVVGQSYNAVGDWGVVVMKYARDGTSLWVEPARYDPGLTDPSAGDVEIHGAARDASGNIYVAGESEYWDGAEWVSSALMLKFAASDGSRLWGKIYESATGRESSFSEVAVRDSLVVGVGCTWPEPEDALVVRYNTSGVLKHSREWGVGDAYGERYGDVAIDGSYNIYVTGGQWGNWEKAVTMKLRPDLTTAWKATFLPTSSLAEGRYIARNSLGNVYVAGARWTSTGLMDILTLKYSSSGVRQWARVWSAGGAGDDTAHGLVLGTSGGAHVVGKVTNVGGFSQAVLLKYKL
jgi:hypothetical protein